MGIFEIAMGVVVGMLMLYFLPVIVLLVSFIVMIPIGFAMWLYEKLTTKKKGK